MLSVLHCSCCLYCQLSLLSFVSIVLLQLVDRFAILFMPQKYQPDYKYLRHVPLKKVHIFTGIQVLCLAILWLVKSFKAISIGFPVMVSLISIANISIFNMVFKCQCSYS